jgi:hypothetical protein
MGIGQTLRIVSVLVLLTALSGCWQSVSWHQKLTLVIETPTGEVTGSAVTSVSITESGAMSRKIGNAVGISVTGEAVVVEVAPGQYLFALLDGAEHWADPLAAPDIRDPWPWWRSIAASKETAVLGGNLIPMLVTFDDINDPASVKLVNPSDLAASFGPGVNLKAVTLAITGEPMTEGRVEAVLGWLHDVWPNQLDGQRFEDADAQNRVANSLSANSFSTEISK